MADPKENPDQNENTSDNIEAVTPGVFETPEGASEDDKSEDAALNANSEQLNPSDTEEASDESEASEEPFAEMLHAAADEETTDSQQHEVLFENAESQPVAEEFKSETEATTAESLEVDPAAHDDVNLDDGGDDEEVEEVEKGDPYGGHSHEALKRILESALFASGATLSVSHLRGVFERKERPHGKIVRQIMAELIALYEDRGVQLVEVASGYRFQTDPESAPWISRLWEEKPQRYSRALMETIALVAYRQPITRGEIEDVRGVAVSSNIIRTLLEREWVRVVGHRDVPGRPAMYATTRQFLDYFSLKSLDQLPNLSEIRDMDELNPQMDLESGDNETENNSEQSEITFSGMIDKLRETQADGKTGSEFIDEQLDGELAAMDEVNASFENALEQQRAEHEHPDLELEDDETDSETDELSESPSQVLNDPAEPEPQQPDDHTNLAEDANSSITEEPELSEEEQWKVIQEKLAQQQALLDGRENDQSREENEDE